MLCNAHSMLSTQDRTRRRQSSPGSAKRTRVLQRRLHVITGLAIVVYVYAGPAAHAPLTLAVRWLLLPLLAISGVAMWQWPRIRRLTRQGARR
jgi:hypothetical protein